MDYRIKELFARFVYWNLLILMGIFFKFYVATGSKFNTQIYDDENTWISELDDFSSLDYILHRDLPGYFIVPFRIILLLFHFAQIDLVTAVRYSVIIIQVVCVFTFVISLKRLNFQYKLQLFCVIIVIPLEDLNYLHNVGYWLILPVISMYFISFGKKKSTQIICAILASALITKPLVALALLLAIGFELALWNRINGKSSTRAFALTLSTLSSLYLAFYFLLPNEFQSPEKFEYVTLVKMLINAPWIFATTFIPTLNIGLMGFVHLNWDGFSLLIGALVYFANVIVIIFLAKDMFVAGRRNAINLLKQREFRFLTISLFCTLICAFSVSNFVFVTEFPLWHLAYTPRIWMRWASMIPVFAAALFAYYSQANQQSKIKTKTLSFLLVQYVALWIFSRPELIRWQPQI